METQSPAVSILGDAHAFGQSLERDLQDATRVAIAVAFAKESALSASAIETWCQAGHTLRLLAGTDFALTELELLRRLELTNRAECRIYHSIGSSIFHPKLYILDKDTTRVIYVGSSNFTRGGLLDNVEANVRVQAPIGTPEVDAANELFDHLFRGEFATPVTKEFEAGYRELQDAMRRAQAAPLLPEASERFRVTESLLLGGYRARVAVQKWLLVVNPANFRICMQRRLWGRQARADVAAYTPGDIFFFHVTGGRGIAAFGMFTGEPFLDHSLLWPGSRGGTFPWRIRFLPLGELRTGVQTREVLAPLRFRPPKHWFNGFIQQSHSLTDEDFQALLSEVERAIRSERLGAFMS